MNQNDWDVVNFLDLKTINLKYKEEFIKATRRIIDSGWYIGGKEVAKFEEDFSKYCGTDFCLGTGNGYDALLLIFKGYLELGILKEGDEIIVPSNSFIASALAISACNLKPIFIDPSPINYNIDLENIKRKISSKTKGILVVHLYGRIAELEEICDFAKQNELLLIEDSAQAHGAELNGRKAGNWGSASAFSFYPGKNLGAIGDAGAVTTSDELLYETIKKIANYGSAIKYKHEYVGVNTRLDPLQAAYLSIKLRHLDEDILKRQKIANKYNRFIDNNNIIITERDIAFSNKHVYHLYVIQSNKRNELKSFLENNGIETLIHYPTPIHKQKAYLSFSDLELPIAESLSNQILSIPIHQEMSKEHVSKVISSINSFQ